MQQSTTGRNDATRLEEVVTVALRGQSVVDTAAGLSFDPRPIRPAQPQESVSISGFPYPDFSTSSSGDNLLACATSLTDFPVGLYALARTTEEQAPPLSNRGDQHSDLTPRPSQDCAANLYTPRWTRGRGTARQGWCGLCQPGRWLDLRNSEYWYDKLYRHGIDTNGNLLSRPQNVRKTTNNRGWECLCAACTKWISLKRGEASWFRHAYEASFEQTWYIMAHTTNKNSAVAVKSPVRRHPMLTIHQASVRKFDGGNLLRSVSKISTNTGRLCVHCVRFASFTNEIFSNDAYHGFTDLTLQ